MRKIKQIQIQPARIATLGTIEIQSGAPGVLERECLDIFEYILIVTC